MSSLEAPRSRTPERFTRQVGRLSWPQARTAVVERVAAVSQQHAWQQPILCLADAVVGVAVGVVAAWTGILVKRLLPAGREVPAGSICFR